MPQKFLNICMIHEKSGFPISNKFWVVNDLKPGVLNLWYIISSRVMLKTGDMWCISKGQLDFFKPNLEGKKINWQSKLFFS